MNDNVGFWDSVLIENLTEETFISNIYQRYKRGFIYTYIGAFLVSVNPYRPLANYSSDVIRTYAKSNYFKLPPHIYGLTNLAYRSLLDQNENQCICVLGEKSSGKTENVRLILHFLTNLNKENATGAYHKSNAHTVSGTATTLMRCKSLVTYPSPHHELPTTRTASTKCMRDVERLRSESMAGISGSHQYKSLDDVSKCHTTNGGGNTKLPQPNTSVTFKALNQKHNCDDRKHNNLTTLLHGEKTPIRTRKLLIAKRDLHQQCERCGYVQLNGHVNDNNWLRKTQANGRERSDSATGKSTNLKKHRSVSTQSLGFRYDANDDGATRILRHRICSALVLLEAFGNASDPVNCNSSRFGSFFDIELDFKGDPLAAHVNYYMLEKTRVTDRGAGERNFHIFYQLLSGADIHFLKSVKLQRNSEKYQLLKRDQTTEMDREDFRYTKNALDTTGLSSDEIINIFKILSVILKLGNLTFIPTTNIDGTGGCEITNEYELIEISELIRLDADVLMNCLTKSDHKWSCLESDSDLDATNAARIRNSLCRTLYGRLFTWLIGRINESLKRKHNSLHGKQLGVLDFFGFENHTSNTFEQFVINYCNEKLHQNYVQNVIKNRQEVYVRDGLDWSRIDFFDNEMIVDLLDRPSYGILNLLDEAHVKNDDETFLLRVHQCCAGHPNYVSDDNGILRNGFQIRHFAGQVNYSAQGFVEKNNDRIPRNVSVAFHQSTLPIVQSLFPEGNPNRAIRNPSSLSSTIRMQLQSLLALLQERKSHYVLCIKPNELKKPHSFELPLVQHQIRYMSLMPLVNIWRMGYCHHLAHATFFNRYKLLHNDTWPFYDGGSLIEGIATIIRGLPLPSAEFILGTNCVFMRSPRTVFELEEFRRGRLHHLMIVIQTKFRSFVKRKNFLQMKRSQIKIARTWRTWRDCRYGVFTGQNHVWELYPVAKETHRITKFRKIAKWAVDTITNYYIRWKQRHFLQTLTLRLPTNSMSPISCEWITAPRHLAETSRLLKVIFHKWRCYKYRKLFDQVARNRMREKLTASLIFKNRKTLYALSVPHPFSGDYVRLRQNAQWKKLCVASNDQYIVFADIINKIARSTGKIVPILMALSTSAMLLLDQRTLQIKYRIPATEIYRLSLSPFHDNIAVFHVKASEVGRKKGDFVFQTAHVIEVITKLFLVVQNAIGRQPEVCIDPEFEATFGNQTVVLSFICSGTSNSHSSPMKITRKNDRMEIIV